MATLDEKQNGKTGNWHLVNWLPDQVSLQFGPQVRLAHLEAHVVVPIDQADAEVSWYKVQVVLQSYVRASLDLVNVLCVRRVRPCQQTSLVTTHPGVAQA